MSRFIPQSPDAQSKSHHKQPEHPNLSVAAINWSKIRMDIVPHIQLSFPSVKLLLQGSASSSRTLDSPITECASPQVSFSKESTLQQDT